MLLIISYYVIIFSNFYKNYNNLKRFIFMLTSLQIGKLAPNFSTVGVYKNQLGKIRLSDYRGKKYVILIFYPANFTLLSLKELRYVNEYIRKFQALSTQILAISIDSPFSHLQFLSSSYFKKNLIKLNYPLISDLTKEIANKYNLLTEDGLCFPGVFIIDKDGVIQYYNVNNLLCGRDIGEILRVLRVIQYLKTNLR